MHAGIFCTKRSRVHTTVGVSGTIALNQIPPIPILTITLFCRTSAGLSQRLFSLIFPVAQGEREVAQQGYYSSPISSNLQYGPIYDTQIPKVRSMVVRFSFFLFFVLSSLPFSWFSWFSFSLFPPFSLSSYRPRPEDVHTQEPAEYIPRCLPTEYSDPVAIMSLPR